MVIPDICFLNSKPDLSTEAKNQKPKAGDEVKSSRAKPPLKIPFLKQPPLPVAFELSDKSLL